MPLLKLQIGASEDYNQHKANLPTIIEKEVMWDIIPRVSEKGWVSKTYDTCLEVSAVHHYFSHNKIEVEFTAPQETLKLLVDDPNDNWTDLDSRDE